MTTRRTLAPLPPPHSLSPHAYPEHCGAISVLRWDGWRCLSCGSTMPFRDDCGRTWQDMQVPETDFSTKES